MARGSPASADSARRAPPAGIGKRSADGGGGLARVLKKIGGILAGQYQSAKRIVRAPLARPWARPGLILRPSGERCRWRKERRGAHERDRHNRAHGDGTDSLLLDAGATAALLGCGRRKLFSMLAAGEIPAPIRFGKRLTWRRSELRRLD